MPAAPPTPSILVVDDDEGLLILVQDALRREHWNVATASSGADGLAWLRLHPVDLLLLDLKLQDIEGNGFISALAAAGRAVPFIIITGQGDERVAVDMMKRGALDYLVKNIHFVEILPMVVRSTLERLEKEKRLAIAEKAVRESAERYRLLTETAGTVILLLARDGTILEWGGEAERIHGYTAAEAVGKNYLTLCLKEEDRAGVGAQLENIHRGMPTKGYETTVRTRDGRNSTFVWNASLLRNDLGRPLGALAVGHDITQRKQAEAALRRSEASLAQAQALAHVGSYSIDLAALAQVWSAEACRILGLDPAAPPPPPPQALRALVHPEDQSRVRETFVRAMADGIELDLEFRAVRGDGAIRFVHVIGEAMRDEAGKVARHVGTIHDITERRELEREILDIAEREQRRFGQDLHDGLGQRLTALELFSHTLLDGLKERAPSLVKPCEELGHELRQTIRQTRALSHGLSPVALEAEGLMLALRELAENTSALAKVDCHFASAPPVLLSDPSTAIHLYRIAQEAVNNALKHGQPKQIRISLGDLGESIELRVEDNGRGFTPPAPGSNGMGLRVMQYRAGLIGATLEFDSAPRQGVLVTCTVRKRP